MSDALSLIHHVPSFIAWMPGAAEWIVIAAFGLILFGKRLPEVGRSLGKGIVEFKKGLKGVEDEVDEAVNNPTPSRSSTGAKFDPYTGKPVDQAVEVSHDAGHEKVS